MEDVSYNANEILVPAPFTFAIWGLIYIGMIAFTIYQLRKDTLHDSTIQKIRPRIALNFIANGLWLPAATLLNRSWTTIVLILFMWFTLGYINKELKGYAHAKATKRYIVMPMSIYFGWITIATPLNMASLVNQRGFTPAVQSVPRVLFWI
ncbi:tryptophan-rich sensory protein [Patescibacteria group bacterium]|nr:tryptophan-rich sensory protein [Patescibacteria group bacterium]